VSPQTGRAHDDDHIDIFLNTFRMDHDIALARPPADRALHPLALRSVAHQAPDFQAEREGPARHRHRCWPTPRWARTTDPGRSTVATSAGSAPATGASSTMSPRNLQRVDERAATFALSAGPGGARASRGPATDRRHRRRAEEPALAPAGAAPARTAPGIASSTARSDRRCGRGVGSVGRLGASVQAPPRAAYLSPVVPWPLSSSTGL